MGPYTLVPALPQKALSAATTAVTGGIVNFRGETARLTVVLQSAGTTSGGTVTIEEAYYDLVNGDPVYSGTWSAVTTAIAASTFTGGAQVVYHFVGSFWAVRLRVSADITGGGSVSGWIWGN